MIIRVGNKVFNTNKVSGAVHDPVGPSTQLLLDGGHVMEFIDSDATVVWNWYISTQNIEVDLS